MREIITLQIGQCGNQMGFEYWRRITKEHGLDQDGVLRSEKDLNDRKDVFFYQADDNKYVPRCLLIDLEPRVITNTSPLFSRENIFMPDGGSGAGNNWAHGYHIASKNKEEIIEMIQREAEGCDCFEGFSLCHSIAGGTGSGFGSFVLENLRDIFPKKILQTYSIFPNNEESSDVVVQPYNSVLTIKRLYEYSDLVVVMDNSALGKLTLDSLRIDMPTYEHINTLIATVMSSSTSTIRFPSYSYCDMSSISSTLVPFDDLKFVVPSYTPFVFDEMSRIVRKTSCFDVMRRLLVPKTRLATFDIVHRNSVISIMNILHGVEDPTEVHKSIYRLLDKKNINFVQWMPPTFNVSLNKRDSKDENNISGLSLCNSTGISTLLSKIVGQFDKLYRQKAFVDTYKRYGLEVDLFDSAREGVAKAIEEYDKSNYNSFVID